MHINTLSDDCLRLIFRHLTVAEQIHLRSSICSRWYTVLSQILASYPVIGIFGSMREVLEIYRNKSEHNMKLSVKFFHNTLIIPDPEQQQYCCTAVGFRAEDCAILSPEIFSSLKNLGIHTKSHFEDVVPRVLSQFHSLQALTLCGLPKKSHLIEQIWHQLTQMQKLTLLRLINLFRIEIPPTLSILANLHKLIIVHYLSSLVPILSQLKSIQALIISWIYLSTCDLIEALEANPHLRQLKGLSLGFICAHSGNRESNFRKVFRFVCDNFTELTLLDMLVTDHVSLCIIEADSNSNPSSHH